MCLSRVERMIALRYLRPKRREGFVSVISLFSVLGIMLGVATLILVTSLMNGIREEMTNRFIGMDGHLSLYHVSGKIDLDFQPLLMEIVMLPGRVSNTPKITGQVMASHAGRALGAQVISMPPESYDEPDNLVTKALDPAMLERLKAGEGIVLGAGLARSLGVNVGDSLMLISPNGRATIAGMVPRMKSYPVVGTISLGMHLYDSSLILMPFDAAQIYFQMTEGKFGSYERMDIMIKDPSKAQEAAAALRRAVGPNFPVTDWQTSNQSVFQALVIQRNVMVIILALIILVAAFNIISSLIMLVQDKGPDIAILRTMGASRRTIMTIFCLSGSLLGLIGTAAGLGLGLFLAANLEAIKQWIETLTGQPILIEQIYFLSTLPTKTDPAQVVVIVLAAIGVAFAATLYPAWRASRLNPAEALRYE